MPEFPAHPVAHPAGRTLSPKHRRPAAPLSPAVGEPFSRRRSLSGETGSVRPQINPRSPSHGGPRSGGPPFFCRFCRTVGNLGSILRPFEGFPAAHEKFRGGQVPAPRPFFVPASSCPSPRFSVCPSRLQPLLVKLYEIYIFLSFIFCITHD